MRYVIAVVVLLAACPASGRELMTKDETPVHAKPEKGSRVLAKVPKNHRIRSDRRKDLWFHVSVKVEGEAVEGWVHQAAVTTLMGRSKGQLLAENKRLYEEVVQLRREVERLREKLAALEAELKAAKEQLEQRGKGGRPKASRQEGRADE
ncbi:MAG: hypothetical protein R6V58_14210 [Planctomycetota bacterium]